MRRFGKYTAWRGRRGRCRRAAPTPGPSAAVDREKQEKAHAQLEASPPRAARRFIPKRAITVAVNEDGFPLAWGQVRDLSESGACVVTDLVLKRGWTIDLKVSLDQLDVLETRGHVVWSGAGPEGDHSKSEVLGAVLHGVQFTGLPDAVRSRLKGLLTTNAFEIAPTLLGGAADRTPFQDMLEALQPELDRLRSKME